MTPQQGKTMKRAGLVSILPLVWVVGLLVVEGAGLAGGGGGTISEVIWLAWAAQPGPIMLCLVTLAFWAGGLASHFFWQSSDVYASVRSGSKEIGK